MISFKMFGLFVLRAIYLHCGRFFITSMTITLIFTILSWTRPNSAYALTCDELNQRLALTKLFIDKSVLLEAQQTRILHVFMSYLDPFKIYFHREDYEYFRSEFGFTAVADATMTIDCTIIDEIVQLFHQRLKYVIDYTQQLNYDDIKHGPGRQIEFYYEHDDYAKNYEEGNERLLNRLRLESLLLEFSPIFKSHHAKAKLVLKTIASALVQIYNYFDFDSAKGQNRIYNLFVKAVYVAIDRDVTYIDDETFAALRSALIVQNMRGATMLNLNTQLNDDRKLSFVGSLLNVSRNWEEPFWRIAAVHDSHNKVALSNDLFRPGDILFAMSVGESGSILDLSYSHSITDINERSLEAKNTRNTKRQKVIVALRPADDGSTATLRVISFSQKGSGLAQEDGTITFAASHPDLPSDIDIGYVKILTFPDDKNPFTLSELSVKGILQNLARRRPDVIVLDLRFNNILENGHNSWNVVQELMSAFLPEGTSLGYVRERFTDGTEDAYLLNAARPEYLSDEAYAKLLDTPLVVFTSFHSREYHEWVAHILKHYRRALIVGDAFTASKDTVNSEVAIPGSGFITTLPGIRLYTPGGLNFADNPLLTDVVVPSLIPSETTIDVRYPENSYDDSLVEFEPTPLGDEYTNWLPDQVVDTLAQRTAERIKANLPLLNYQKLSDATSRPELMRAQPKLISLDPDQVVRVHSSHITPPPVDQLTSSKGKFIWAENILELDHTAVEALKVAAEYFITLTDTPLPAGPAIEILPHDSLIPPDPEPTRPSPQSGKKRKNKSSRGGGVGF